MENEAPLDITKLTYVLYARKSTDNSKNQVRSIDDQIAKCKQLAERLGIHIANIIIEKKSAKVPGKRPLFRAMLKDIRKGKYDGILAWHPDRLARNTHDMRNEFAEKCMSVHRGVGEINRDEKHVCARRKGEREKGAWI